VLEFLSACSSRRGNQNQQQFFASRANYLENGRLSRAAIEARMKRFESFWSKRKYTPKGKPVLSGPLKAMTTVSNNPSPGLFRADHGRVRGLAYYIFEFGVSRMNGLKFSP
jgi:hypothetical protein